MSEINSKKNIMLILPYGSVGGMERLALTFYEHYRTLGYLVKAVKFIKLETDIINFGDDEIYLSSKDFEDMSMLHRYSFYMSIPPSIRKYIKKFNITHSIAFGDMANLFSSLTFTKEFKIGSVHALKSVELSSPTHFNKLIWWGYRSSYGNLDKLVCISKSIYKDLIDNCNYKFNNLEVIYNPHDIGKLVSMSKEPIDDVEEQKLFEKESVLFLGRLSVQKSPWHLIQAFKSIEEERPKAIMIFIGDGDKKVLRYIKKLTKHLDIEEKIFFLGRRTNPYKYLKKVSCLALSSYYEGTPNVIVEAIALGTPVVSSYCTAGILELMETDDEVTYDDEDILTTVAGKITPNFYKGLLEVPREYKNMPSTHEKLFGVALKEILSEKNDETEMRGKREELLKKFDIDVVAHQYLTLKL